MIGLETCRRCGLDMSQCYCRPHEHIEFLAKEEDRVVAKRIASALEKLVVLITTAGQQPLVASQIDSALSDSETKLLPETTAPTVRTRKRRQCKSARRVTR